MRLNFIILVLLAFAAHPAYAGDIQPGLWELTMETSVPATPDFSMPPNTVSQCLTEQDAQDPSSVLGSVANPGASDCTFSEKRFSGNTLHFRMQCAGTLGMQTQGDVTYTATSIEGDIVTSAVVLGQPTMLHSKIRGRRVGGC
ncbi:MAG TPA: DUF3617 family protein [Gallionella sp.]